MAEQKTQHKKPDPVKSGGIAPSDADAEDVTRDTYGFEQAEPDKPTSEERFREAERAAEEEGIPGVEIPEEPALGQARKTTPRRADLVGGDTREGAERPTLKR